MFEIVIGLTVFGILYVAVVEILEKCVDRLADKGPAQIFVRTFPE